MPNALTPGPSDPYREFETQPTKKPNSTPQNKPIPQPKTSQPESVGIGKSLKGERFKIRTASDFNYPTPFGDIKGDRASKATEPEKWSYHDLSESDFLTSPESSESSLSFSSETVQDAAAVIHTAIGRGSSLDELPRTPEELYANISARPGFNLTGRDVAKSKNPILLDTFLKHYFQKTPLPGRNPTLTFDPDGTMHHIEPKVSQSKQRGEYLHKKLGIAQEGGDVGGETAEGFHHGLGLLGGAHGEGIDAGSQDPTSQSATSQSEAPTHHEVTSDHVVTSDHEIPSSSSDSESIDATAEGIGYGLGTMGIAALALDAYKRNKTNKTNKLTQNKINKLIAKHNESIKHANISSKQCLSKLKGLIATTPDEQSLKAELSTLLEIINQDQYSVKDRRALEAFLSNPHYPAPFDGVADLLLDTLASIYDLHRSESEVELLTGLLEGNQKMLAANLERMIFNDAALTVGRSAKQIAKYMAEGGAKKALEILGASVGGILWGSYLTAESTNKLVDVFERVFTCGEKSKQLKANIDKLNKKEPPLSRQDEVLRSILTARKKNIESYEMNLMRISGLTKTANILAGMGFVTTGVLTSAQLLGLVTVASVLGASTGIGAGVLLGAGLLGATVKAGYKYKKIAALKPIEQANSRLQEANRKLETLHRELHDSLTTSRHTQISKWSFDEGLELLREVDVAEKGSKVATLAYYQKTAGMRGINTAEIGATIETLRDKRQLQSLIHTLQSLENSKTAQQKALKELPDDIDKLKEMAKSLASKYIVSPVTKSAFQL